jgi:hypothetical protein
MKDIFYFIIVAIIGIIIYNVIRNAYIYLNTKEGLMNIMNAPELKVYDMVSDGIAGNAKNYASSLKNASVEIQDKFLINKYRSDYETILINMDDLINNLMLKQTLTLDEKNPLHTIENLAKMQQAKSALNSVMKFIDSQ